MSAAAVEAASVVACPSWCTEPAGHYVAPDLNAPHLCSHHGRVGTVVGVVEGDFPATATVDLIRVDEYHPMTGYVRYEHVVIDCEVHDAGFLTPGMARELASTLIRAAELAELDAVSR